MTTNVVQGATAQFVVKFLDDSGTQIVPDKAYLTISYPTGLAVSSSSVLMTPADDGLFTATWYSNVASPGPGTWAAESSGATISGDIRVTQNAAAPRILSITPPTGPSGSTVTVSGVNLLPVTSVAIDGISAEFTVIDDNTVTVVVP